MTASPPHVPQNNLRPLLVLLALLATPAFASDLDVVRQQYIGFYTAAGADRSSPRMQASLGGTYDTVRGYIAPGFLRADGSWSDINYAETPGGSWSPYNHVERLEAMAKAYRMPGQPLYGDPQLRTAIESALAYVPKFYGATTLPSGNWWFWTLGVPLDLGPTLVLMRADVSQQVYDDCVTTLTVHIGLSPTSRGLIGPAPVGENLVWSCYTHLALGLLRDDATILNNVRDAMADVAMPTASGDGVKPDSAFHQHGPQLYTGGYGGAFADDMARYALITRGTSFTFPGGALNAVADYIADGIAWALYGNYFDASVTGREVVRPTTSGISGLAALVEAAQFDSPRRDEIRAAAAKMLQSWQWTLPPELAGLATKAEQSFTPGALSGHRHYWSSDYTVHRREGWFASIKMFSSRTKSGEKTNNENLLGSRQSDGRLYLVLDGNEYFGRDIWPALDWSRLPGITVEQKPGAADSTFGFGTRTLAGGTGDGRNGVSAMQLAPLNSALTANKAWFFFDDAILFLTNSINCPTANRSETIVNQWPLMNPGAPVLTGDGWAWCEDVGYVFPNRDAVKIDRATRSGTYVALGGSTDATTYTKSFVTLSLDHGPYAAGRSAEYLIVPNISATALQSWTALNPITILSNTASVSAARDKRTNATGIAFWTVGAFNGFAASAPLVVYMTDDGYRMTISAADPTCAIAGTIRLTLPKGFSPTFIDIPANGGKTYSASATRSVRRRAR
jgi:chondroitin AC lyase